MIKMYCKFFVLMPTSTILCVRKGNINCNTLATNKPIISCPKYLLCCARYWVKKPQLIFGALLSCWLKKAGVGSTNNAIPRASTFSPIAETLPNHLLQNSCLVYLIKPMAGSATSTFFTVELGVTTTK